MGSSESTPPLVSSLTPTKDTRYGGNIHLDKPNSKAYQILQLD